MTTTVTKESLAARIAELESGARSLKEDYTLAAYKMLLATMEAEPDRKERKLLCSTDTARMRKVISASASAGAEDAPLYRHAQPEPVVPDGYVVVPKEPTDEMQSAGASAIRIETTALNKLWTGNAVFRAMLAAAPAK